MADNKTGPGPKTADSKRDTPVSDAQGTAGADQYLDDARGRVFGDNTSSTAGANNPGQHGRDGGEIDSAATEEKRMSNNPAPSEDAQEPALAEQRKQEEEEKEAKKNEKNEGKTDNRI